ncbi:MAG: ABC transporter permease [Rhizobiales bacterium]|jgi:ribose transport system permease protein|nr:ABC transporter permease [Hyphomicrobiales bacterium]
MDRVKSLLKELDVVVILGALLLVAAIFRASTFYNLDNLFAILELSAVLGIATLGEALVLIVRGVDISVGAMMGLAGTLSAFLLPDYGMAAAVLLPLLACGLLGLANGLLIEKGRIPPIVATIGMMWVVGGLAGSISSGRLIPIQEQAFQNIALGSIFEVVPLFFVGLLVIGVVALFVRSNFSIGRYVYAVGGDEGAAYYSAIPVSRIRIAVYGVAGILYGIAGLLMASYVRSGMPAVGKGYEFKAITAAVLGGIALTGGRGNLLKAILGAVILIVLYGVVTAFAVSPYIQGIIQGCILVGAVYYATRHD